MGPEMIEMQCARCGAKVEKDWVACPRCGLSLVLPPPGAIVARILIKTIGGAIRAGQAIEEAEARKKKEFGEADAIRIEREIVEDIEKVLLDVTDTYEHEVKKSRKKKE